MARMNEATCFVKVERPTKYAGWASISACVRTCQPHGLFERYPESLGRIRREVLRKYGQDTNATR